jgi:hypothetical protein
MPKKPKKQTKGKTAAAPLAATAAAPTSGTPPKELRRFTERLSVKNNDEQNAILAGQLADVIRERLALQEDKSAKNREFREQRAYLDERERELADAVHSHTRFEEVECVEVLLPTNEVQVVRVDTGEVVSSRAATGDELQESALGEEDMQPTARRSFLDDQAPAAPVEGEIADPAGVLRGDTEPPSGSDFLGDDFEGVQETPGP